METGSSEPVSAGPFDEGLGPAVVYGGFRLGALLAESIPPSVSDRVVDSAAEVVARLAVPTRKIVARNLARVVGDGPRLDDTVNAAFRSYGEYWLETLRLGRYSREDIISMVDPTPGTVECLDEAFSEGNGVVLVTGHIGFYDLGVAWTGARGWPFTTVAEVLKPRALFEWFAEIRRRNGMDVIPAKPGSEAREKLIALVRRGEGVALLADRDLGRRGIWVEMFGEATTIPAGPAIVLARTGAAMVAGAIYKKGSRFEVHFERVPYRSTGDESQDLPVLAQTIARSLEELVLRAPEQWHLFSTNWPSDEPHLPPRGRIA